MCALKTCVLLLSMRSSTKIGKIILIDDNERNC